MDSDIFQLSFSPHCPVLFGSLHPLQQVLSLSDQGNVYSASSPYNPAPTIGSRISSTLIVEVFNNEYAYDSVN